ncbi:MAG: UDP-N-acetylmuramate dehydrogenase [Pseudomonadales bacterium]
MKLPAKTGDLSVQAAFELRPFNTLGVRSTAEFAVIARSNVELLEALRWAGQRGMPVAVLGGGSNVIPAPEVPGLTVIVKTRGVELERSARRARLVAQAGEPWHDLVRYSLGQGLGELANLVLIPGSVGAAPIQNIGAYGSELADTLERVQIFDRDRNEVRWLAAAQCGFGYRTSRFKEQSDPGGLGPRQIVLALELALTVATVAPLSADRYGDVNAELATFGKRAVWPVDVAEAVARIRRRKLPDPRRIGNVGSVFKNPVVTSTQAQRLRQAWPELKTFAAATGVRLSAAQLIDRCGWKGRRLGGAGVWDRQPLVLTMQSGHDSADFVALLEAIAASVGERFDVTLEPEPRRLPELIPG